MATEAEAGKITQAIAEWFREVLGRWLAGLTCRQTSPPLGGFLTAVQAFPVAGSFIIEQPLAVLGVFSRMRIRQLVAAKILTADAAGGDLTEMLNEVYTWAEELRGLVHSAVFAAALEQVEQASTEFGALALAAPLTREIANYFRDPDMDVGLLEE